MESGSVRFLLTRADFLAYQMYVRRKFPRRLVGFYAILGLMAVLAAALFVVQVRRSGGLVGWLAQGPGTWGWAPVAVLPFPLYWGLPRLAARRYAALPSVAGPRTLAWGPDGVAVRMESGASSHHPWATFVGVDETKGAVYLVLGAANPSVAAIIVPKSAFADQEQAAGFVAAARRRLPGA